ncbi:N-(5'-phosphoribosyl)anthranilate isomerase [Novosphingobium barchaimii LL02]|uniref:N-(5'-phosphoribosyl)anthranilate isomerase n=1 Tax=Novosphingobium barchaimii LL02 TaxID=1114963 RepID=A0A0J7Y8J8_9SPHN|nr:phosphoribosylanthranilate isomerase [Novosphingobium barchaimii]KMS59942.1 N-(5'-phosphoribosyl)anthranilate isomerase [Novosphingobium barchaimii LL02]
MPSAGIKICGINTPDALEAAIKSRAAHIGLVFFPRSPRAVTPAEAAQLSARAEGRISRVGLFVDASDTAIGDAMGAARLDALQLHGEETPERAAQLRARFGVSVWKALPVATARDVERAAAYADAVDLILFDAKTPKGALPGGMGLSFDWSLIAHWKGPVAWGLAGGLDAANVAEAIRMTGTPLVDTSSGVESAPGVKDESRIAAFCRAVREAG